MLVAKTMMVSALVVVGTLMVSTAFASDVGRFQAIRVKDSSTFILDTQEGHMWVWALGELVYQGRIKPGETMGEVVLYEPTRPGLAPTESKRLKELEEIEMGATTRRIEEDTIERRGEREFVILGQPPAQDLSPEEAKELELLRSKIKED
jgi:hypothetical protein